MSAEAEAVKGAAEAVEATGGIAALGINGKIFLAQLINFLIVLLVFWKWIYGPIVKMLDKRASTIEKSVKDAAAVEVRVAKLEDERKEVMAQAKREASLIFEKARGEADERKAELLEKAKAEVDKVVKDGKAMLVKEKAAMLQEAKKDMAAIVVEAARAVLKEQISEAASQKSAEKAVEKLTGV